MPLKLVDVSANRITELKNTGPTATIPIPGFHPRFLGYRFPPEGNGSPQISIQTGHQVKFVGEIITTEIQTRTEQLKLRMSPGSRIILDQNHRIEFTEE